MVADGELRPTGVPDPGISRVGDAHDLLNAYAREGLGIEVDCRSSSPALVAHEHEDRLRISHLHASSEFPWDQILPNDGALRSVQASIPFRTAFWIELPHRLDDREGSLEGAARRSGHPADCRHPGVNQPMRRTPCSTRPWPRSAVGPPTGG